MHNVYSIREFAAPSTPIILLDKDSQAVYTTLEQLLPMSFGPDDLNGHRRRQQQQQQQQHQQHQQQQQQQQQQQAAAAGGEDGGH